MVRITVGGPTHRASERLYGVFFEDINHGADGGLNANMVNNYSFDGVYLDHRTWHMSGSDRWRTQADPLRFWDFDRCTATSQGTEIRGEHGQYVKTDCPAPPIHDHSRYARITTATGPASIENLGYNGGGENADEPAFSIITDHLYDVRFRIRPVCGQASLSIGAVDRYGLPMTSMARLDYDPEDDDDWRCFTAQVRGQTTGYGKLRISIEACDATTFDLDLVQFMDADHWGAADPKWRYGKMRRDLVEAIKALHPGFVRFPGGCIVEGVTPGNEYRWKDTIGALPARRQQYSMWSFKMPDGSSYSQSYQIGFYEYFCLCEDLDAKPLPTLFAGIACQSPGRDPRHMDIDSEAFSRNVVQDYLDLIEFANGDPETSSWAAIRRDMGHPAPFGLDMIGVGNENFGPDYIAKFDRISQAIHERHPDMLCIMSAGLFPLSRTMKRTWDHARLLARNGQAAHDGATGDAIIVDEHSYHSSEWFESQATRFDDYPRCGAGVYFGEYSANGYFAGQPQTERGANTWKSALGEAAFLTGCERNCDVVRMTSYAPLFAHIPAKGWAQNLIEFNPAHVNPTLNYEVERMFSTHMGDMVYDVDIARDQSAKHLYVSATGSDGGESCRYIKIVNTSKSPVDVTLDVSRGLTGLSGLTRLGIAGKPALTRLEVETLTADPMAKTTLAYQGEARGAITAKRHASTLASPGSLLAMKIKPYSVTLVTLR
jgi:alpha-L-arabinofuranosidase